MLAVALNYEEELNKKFRETWYVEKYKYFTHGCYNDELELNKTNWSDHQFVSLDNNNDVIGFIDYVIDRANDQVYGLRIINFTDNKIIFGRDVGQTIINIFEKFNFRKLVFNVIVGNPIESTYDRLIQKYHGRIIGIKKDDVRLFDGIFYDLKMYEIFRDDYFKARA